MHSKIKITFLFLVVSYIILMCCNSCKDINGGNGNFTSNIVFPETGTISFEKYVWPLFQQTCVAAQCHGGSLPAAALNLSSGTSDHVGKQFMTTKLVFWSAQTVFSINALQESGTHECPLRHILLSQRIKSTASNVGSIKVP